MGCCCSSSDNRESEQAVTPSRGPIYPITAVYCAGELYDNADMVIANLKQSGFTTVIAWAVHVDATGNLFFNDTQLVAKGQYTGHPKWPEKVNGLKKNSSVRRLLFSVGGYGVQDYFHINSLLKSTTGKEALKNNFKALLDTFPEVDGIDMDDEEEPLDHDCIVDFCKMLSSLGFSEVTFCPYRNHSFWEGCLTALNSLKPNPVTAFNLQCYSGGSGNQDDLTPWIDAANKSNAKTVVIPGFAVHTPNEIKSHFTRLSTLQIGGGFIWKYQKFQPPSSASSYCSAIIDGFASAA